MEADTLYTLIGYVGSALVVTSLAMRSILKLRLIGLAGAVTFVIYGYLIDAWPIVWTNVVIVLIHLHFLREIRKTNEYFKVLPVRTVSNYLRHFLDHFATDIKRAWPGFEYEPEEDTLTLFILRDLGSANGTFHNGQRVVNAHLHDGDLVGFSDVFAFRLVVKEGVDYVGASYVGSAEDVEAVRQEVRQAGGDQRARSVEAAAAEVGRSIPLV